MVKETNERFPCSDEHVEKRTPQVEGKSLLEVINERNRALYGEICKRCDLYDYYCSCKK